MTGKIERLNVEGRDDMFAPPAKIVTVECLHCGDVFRSDEIVFEVRDRFTPHTLGSALWWCRNTDCDGAGFDYDIHKSRRRVRPKEVNFYDTPEAVEAYRLYQTARVAA